jgi:hypothetical protein
MIRYRQEEGGDIQTKGPLLSLACTVSLLQLAGRRGEARRIGFGCRRRTGPASRFLCCYEYYSYQSILMVNVKTRVDEPWRKRKR